MSTQYVSASQDERTHRVDLQLDNNSAYSREFSFGEIDSDEVETLYDYTLWTARMSVAQAAGAEPVFTLTNGDGITLANADVDGYNVRIDIRYDQAILLQATDAWVYDLLVIDQAGNPERVMQGEIIINRGVTELP